MEKSLKVSIVILNYNTYELTIQEIENICEVVDYNNLDIIVVDNYSTNDSLACLCTYRDSYKGRYSIHLLNSQKNGGYAAGNNIGIRESIRNCSDYTLIVNNDVLFTASDTITQMVQYMESNERVGVVSPRIISLDGTHDKPIYYKRPTFWDLSFGMRRYKKRIKRQDDELIYEVYAPRGSCMMLKNSDIKEMGLLDEGTFLYYEEPILAESFLKRGKVAVNYGKVGVIHNHAVTIKKNIPNKKVRECLVDSLDYYLKEYRGFNYVERLICKAIRKYAYLLK